MDERDVANLIGHLREQAASIRPGLDTAIDYERERLPHNNAYRSDSVGLLIRYLEATRNVLSQGSDPAARAVMGMFDAAGIDVDGVELSVGVKSVDLIASPGLKRLIAQMDALTRVLSETQDPGR
ncbi:hypothetical protein ACFVVM_02930 [Nocardia sp. NPDC058176]|uniref:hypothetical protein n=1 Tax=Nocardia sp. NPDC058176 TaxID=3346368 RepID=UPI0036D85F21